MNAVAIPLPTIEDRLTNDVERHFGKLPFPELKLVQRAVGDLLASRLAKDAPGARREMDQFDAEHPELVIFH